MRWVIEDVYLQTRDMVLPTDLSWQDALSLPAATDFLLPKMGCVYGVLHNDASSIVALGDAVHAAPYKAPPKAVVLYSKPRNTWRATGQTIVAPKGVTSLHVGASIGIVIGQVATRVSLEKALDYVAGFTVVNDVSVPHDVFYRPSMRFKTFDTSCVIGPWIRSSRQITNPDALNIEIRLDGQLVQSHSTAVFKRNVAQLLSDITEFMTLQPNDVLMLGVAHPPVFANIGQSVSINIEQIGQIQNTIVEAE